MAATRGEQWLPRVPVVQAGLLVTVALVFFGPGNVYADWFYLGLALVVACPVALGLALCWPLRLRSRLPLESPRRAWRPVSVVMQALTAAALLVSLPLSGMVVLFTFWWPDI